MSLSINTQTVANNTSKSPDSPGTPRVIIDYHDFGFIVFNALRFIIHKIPRKQVDSYMHHTMTKYYSLILTNNFEHLLFTETMNDTAQENEMEAPPLDFREINWYFTRKELQITEIELSSIQPPCINSAIFSGYDGSRMPNFRPSEMVWPSYLNYKPECVFVVFNINALKIIHISCYQPKPTTTKKPESEDTEHTSSITFQFHKKTRDSVCITKQIAPYQCVFIKPNTMRIPFFFTDPGMNITKDDVRCFVIWRNKIVGFNQ